MRKERMFVKSTLLLLNAVSRAFLVTVCLNARRIPGMGSSLLKSQNEVARAEQSGPLSVLTVTAK